jgi:hypothetical protein
LVCLFVCVCLKLFVYKLNLLWLGLFSHNLHHQIICIWYDESGTTTRKLICIWYDESPPLTSTLICIWYDEIGSFLRLSKSLCVLLISGQAVASLHHQAHLYLIRWVCYLYSCPPSSVFDTMRYACFFVQASRRVIQSLAVASLHHEAHLYLVRRVCYLYPRLPSSVFVRVIYFVLCFNLWPGCRIPPPPSSSVFGTMSLLPLLTSTLICIW